MTTFFAPDSVREAIAAMMDRRLARAGEYLQSRMRYAISIPGPPRSLPGESPHIDTSDLIESIAVVGVVAADVGDLFEAQKVLVGSPLIYSGYLEFGTMRMAPRPFVLRTLNEQIGAVLDIMTGS